jgi:DNA-binding response OmpR family regulator
MESVAPHVLALDDDPDIRKVLTQYLSEQELRITAVSSGREMLQVIENEPVDLLMIDLRLAGEDGLTLARRVRETSAIPILILSGKAEEADLVMGLELAADDYVTKPFSMRELLARIRAVLRRSQIVEAATPRFDQLRADLFACWELNLSLDRIV